VLSSPSLVHLTAIFFLVSEELEDMFLQDFPEIVFLNVEGSLFLQGIKYL
jgi:hypothetical protein